jgi:uncharacterized protein involved in exopolysaccharide biosynthesis
MSLAIGPRAEQGLATARRAVNYQPYGIRDLLTAIFYHKRIMILAFLLPALLGVGAGLLSKPAFVAQARLLVLYGSEYFYRPATGQSGSSVALDRNEIMQGELEVLQSTTLAIDTLRAVGVDRVYPHRPGEAVVPIERTALRFAHDLTVNVVPQANVLELRFRSADPEIAAQVLRALIAGYLDRRSAIFRRSSAAAAQADQAAFLARLQQAEDALSRYADAHSIASSDQQITLLLQQQSANSVAHDEAVQSASETSAKLAVVNEQLQHVPQTLQTYADSDRSQATQILTENLARLQVKRRDLASRYQDSFPLVQDVDRQIAALQAQIAQVPARDAGVVRTALNPVYQEAQAQAMQLRAQLSGLQARVAQLDAAASSIARQVRDLSQAAREYKDLQRNRDLLDESYRTLVRSNEEAAIADSADRSRTANIRVVQPPERPPVGVNLRRVLIIAGLAVGLIAAVAALAVANALRQVFVTVRDVTVGLELPVVIAVPRPRGRRSRQAPRPAEARAKWVELPSQRVLGA